MLLQTNSYIVPKDRRDAHARLIRRFRHTLARLGCDMFEVYEQTGPNWTGMDTGGRFVQIMRFRDRHHQLQVHSAERSDPDAQRVIADFCDLVNIPYQQQHGLFAVSFYASIVCASPRLREPADADEWSAPDEPIVEEATEADSLMEAPSDSEAEGTEAEATDGLSLEEAIDEESTSDTHASAKEPDAQIQKTAEETLAGAGVPQAHAPEAHPWPAEALMEQEMSEEAEALAHAPEEDAPGEALAFDDQEGGLEELTAEHAPLGEDKPTAETRTLGIVADSVSSTDLQTDEAENDLLDSLDDLDLDFSEPLESTSTANVPLIPTQRPAAIDDDSHTEDELLAGEEASTPDEPMSIAEEAPLPPAATPVLDAGAAPHPENSPTHGDGQDIAERHEGDQVLSTLDALDFEEEAAIPAGKAIDAEAGDAPTGVDFDDADDHLLAALPEEPLQSTVADTHDASSLAPGTAHPPQVDSDLDRELDRLLSDPELLGENGASEDEAGEAWGNELSAPIGLSEPPQPTAEALHPAHDASTEEFEPLLDSDLDLDFASESLDPLEQDSAPAASRATHALSGTNGHHMTDAPPNNNGASEMFSDDEIDRALSAALKELDDAAFEPHPQAASDRSAH